MAIYVKRHSDPPRFIYTEEKKKGEIEKSSIPIYILYSYAMLYHILVE